MQQLETICNNACICWCAQTQHCARPQFREFKSRFDCNICGTDITGNTSAHAKEHMKAGEGSGHHSEIRQIVT
ncbi:hypothetical protein, partial [Adlercreutzia sp.]